MSYRSKETADKICEHKNETRQPNTRQYVVRRVHMKLLRQYIYVVCK